MRITSVFFRQDYRIIMIYRIYNQKILSIL